MILKDITEVKLARTTRIGSNSSIISPVAIERPSISRHTEANIFDNNLEIPYISFCYKIIIN